MVGFGVGWGGGLGATSRGIRASRGTFSSIGNILYVHYLTQGRVA